MANIRTHYDNLKVARNAPDSVIKAAYKALSQTYHPDKFQGSNEEAERIMKLINASYEVLIDSDKRAIHDDWIREQEAEETKQNQQSHFAATEAENEQFHNQKQDTRQEYTPPSPEPKQSKGSTQTYSWRRYFARTSIDYWISGSLIAIAIAFWQAIGLKVPVIIQTPLTKGSPGTENPARL
jgi:DnaJ-class molecular chaperone